MMGMADGPGLETYANHTNEAEAQAAGAAPDGASGDATLKRTILFIAVAAASAGLAFAVIRATLLKPPSDPTTERIQQLIDEANRLLKQLDDKKPD
jgi:hypothetical protein